jgi:amidase
MRSLLLMWLLIGSCASVLAQKPMAPQPIGASGEWVLYLNRGGEQFDAARVVLKQDGQAVAGTLKELKLAGTIAGDTLELSAVRPDGSEFGKFHIKMTGAEWTGTIERGKVETALTMHRIGGIGTSPQTHTFVPTSYSRLFTGTLSPVLHINPGDTVKTTTIDAGGTDEHGVSRALSGNPQTGPFYVEGAVPGDTLAVEIKRIGLTAAPRRARAISHPLP